MTGPRRDWDKELADIDKLMTQAPARPPALPGGDAVPAQRPAPAPAPARLAVDGPTLLGTWVRILLALVLAGAMTQWPYQHACGLPLMLYFGATGVTVIAGLWAAGATWKRRMGVLHGLALLTTLWGIGLAAAVVLPRIGYARQAATWWCQ
ncbi:MAG TPA: hypothetical protein VF862_05595 [Gemmatimonadales bacterium]